MLKTFTLNERIDEKLSATEGRVSFSVTDENGYSREITGTTFLDSQGVPQGVTAENKRELPIIEALFRMKINELTEIDFTPYNNIFDRDNDKTLNQVAYEKVLEMEKEKGIFYKLRNLFNNSNKEEVLPSS